VRAELTRVCSRSRRFAFSLLLAFGLVATACLVACAPPEGGQSLPAPAVSNAAPSAAQTEVANGVGLLWRIDVADRPPSYLFGTIHLADPRILELPPAVESAIDSVAVVGFEHVLDEESKRDVARMMRLENGRDLETVIGSDLYEVVDRLGGANDKFGVALRHMKPWAAALMLQSLNQSPAGAPVLDDRLETLARESDKTVIGLETPQVNIAAFDALPEPYQVDLLRSVISELDLPPEARAVELEIIIRDYLARNTGRLLQRWDDVMEERDATVRGFESYLLFGRSRLFADRMAPWLDQGGAFFAVGSAHLPGADGVVSLLRDAGYKVTRVY
jgi:uncharacterized protein YbaP (TraB family)